MNMKKFLLMLSILMFANLLSINIFAQTYTDGTLTFTFTQTAHSGSWGAKHSLAVWIQNSAGAFVKTKLRYVGNGTKDHLPTWAVNSGGTSSNATSTNCNKTDATTGATLTSYTTRNFTWDGKNVNGSLNGTTVADGTYKVTIEECWNHGTSGIVVKSYTFTKGTVADNQTPANDANFTNVTLSWTPTSTSVETHTESNEISIFPNPSTGIINVNFVEATSITVENILGLVVYTEDLSNTNAKNRSIDLTGYANGIYVVNVINGEKSSKHKVLMYR